MDYKKSTRLLEELLDAKVSIEGEELLIGRGDKELRVRYGFAPVAIAVFMPKEKAWAALEAVYGPRPEEAYKRYLAVPMRACWLNKAVASAIARRLGGEEVAEKLDEEVAKRWPNVCGNVNAFTEALKLVTKMNEQGMTASFQKEDKEGVLKTPYGPIRVRKASPEDEKFLKEMRRLLEEDRETFEEVLRLLGESKSCFDLAEIVRLSEDKLIKYGFIRAKLRERAEELAKEVLFRVRRA